MELLFYGVLMGWGAAIPVGPINLEIIRRNLHYGTRHGLALGLGACLADVTYLVLLGVGAVTLMQYPGVLRALGVAGSLVLAYFGIMALRITKSHEVKRDRPRSTARDFIAGYVLTLFNPFTLLFWTSILSQIALISESSSYALLQSGLGVLAGALSWVLFLNILLHFTRHRLPEKMTRSLNRIGGVILLAFAVFGLISAFFF